MATYPDDVSIDINNFSVTDTVVYTDTGITQTDFNLNTSVSHKGEVLLYSDGLLQTQSSYSLSNSNQSVSMVAPPNAANLTIKIISVPTGLTTIRTFPTISGVTYSNTAVTTVNSNNYLIDGATTTWALPTGASPVGKADMIVSVSGTLQVDDSYTFPSSTLSTNGIDLPVALDGSNTTLDIRVFDTGAGNAVTCRRENLSDRNPDKGFGTTKMFDSIVHESIAGYEKRRLVSRRGKREWNFNYTNLNGMEKQALENFYTNRYGIYESFIFDLSHIREVGTVRVRFAESLDISHSATRGGDLDQMYYNIGVKLTEVYD